MNAYKNNYSLSKLTIYTMSGWLWHIKNIHIRAVELMSNEHKEVTVMGFHSGRSSDQCSTAIC